MRKLGNRLAIRVPEIGRALAPAIDNAYILRMYARKVKPQKLFATGSFPR